MSYSERDLPVHLRDGDILVLDDGTEVRWESSGEAKAVFLGSDFAPLMEIFPGQEESVNIGGKFFTLAASFEDDMEVRILITCLLS